VSCALVAEASSRLVPGGRAMSRYVSGPLCGFVVIGQRVAGMIQIEFIVPAPETMSRAVQALVKL